MDSTTSTENHIKAINRIGGKFILKIAERLIKHDASKLAEPEVSLLKEISPPPRNYGDGWGQSGQGHSIATGGLKLEKDKKLERDDKKSKFLDHHYRTNRHHPEHFEQGVDGMTLVDIIEMYLDWCASTLRTDDGNIYRSIQHNENRFGLSPQLVRIFMNTAIDMDEELRQMRKDINDEEKPSV